MFHDHSENETAVYFKSIAHCGKYPIHSAHQILSDLQLKLVPSELFPPV